MNAALEASKTLFPRILTAVVLAPVVILLVHWGGLAYSLFVAALCALALYEYGVLMTVGGRPVQRWNTLAAGMVLVLLTILGASAGLAAFIALSLILVREILSSAPSLERAALSFLGAAFAGWMPAHLALIRDMSPHGESLSFLLIGSVWAMDSSAYFVGRLIGRRRLSPLVSPKKTWEGGFGGFLAAAAALLIFSRLRPEALPFPDAVALAFLVGILGQISDLSESLVKRWAGAKDSGDIFPGHGGILDRLDSFILSAPAFYYCLRMTAP